MKNGGEGGGIKMHNFTMGKKKIKDVTHINFGINKALPFFFLIFCALRCMCNLLSELETRVQFPEPLTYFHSINILLRRCNHAFSLVTSAASEKMGELRLIPQSGLLSASQPSKPSISHLAD